MTSMNSHGFCLVVPPYYDASMSGFSIVNLVCFGLVGIFNILWSGTKAFKELGPEMEIPGRDLDVGTDNK